MRFQVVRSHLFRDDRGRPVPKKPGDFVEVSRRSVARELIAQGIIQTTEIGSTATVPRVPPFEYKNRIGFFLHTSSFYSGGRLHLYQLAWTLQSMGHEVWMITNRRPLWAADYPKTGIEFAIGPGAPRPGDFDLLITDGKGVEAQGALTHKKADPWTPLVVFNFETPNWVQEFAPDTARRMTHTSAALDLADLVLANSDESLRFLRQYVDLSKKKTGVLPPAMNTFSVDQEPQDPLPGLEGPFVVASARGSEYKGWKTVWETVRSYPEPLHLVCVGKPGDLPRGDADHRIVTFQKPITDAQKSAIMARARAVLAPSLFEGYGMVPAEALANGTPVVVYDLPVLRQEYGDLPVYAEWKNAQDFQAKAHEVIRSGERPSREVVQTVRETYGMGAMEKKVQALPYLGSPRVPRVSAQMIVYYGPTVQEALEAIYDHVHEILIAYGPTPLWKNFPPDDALELIRSFPDPENKIKLEVREVWKNKTQMREWCCRNATGNRMLVVDADEIYQGLDHLIASGIEFGCPQWVHYWHDLDHFVADAPGESRWGPSTGAGTVHPHYRWSVWRSSYRLVSSRGTAWRDPNDVSLCDWKTTESLVRECPEVRIHHLGHVLPPDLMERKHDFYLDRDGRDPGRVARKKVWHSWDGSLGPSGDGVVHAVDFPVPELVRRAYKRLEALK